MSNLPARSWPVQQAEGGAEALVKLESGNWQVLFLDRRLPDLDAEELIVIIERRFPGIEVVLLDSDGQPATGTPGFRSWTAPVSALAGASDSSSFVGAGPSEQTGAAIEPLPGMIGQASSMQRLYRLARLVAGRDTTVLITGPTGTGKELVARGIHQLSRRAARPFVVVNCAAIPEGLLESELFGHVRGAFTGAVQSYAGRIQAAQGGTLFLDEVGELPLGLQAKLLRFLDQKEVQRLGSNEVGRLDVRVVAATNAQLRELVREKKFRADLYYRMSAFPIELPALQERMQDILPLAEHFLRRFSDSGDGPRLSRDAMHVLQLHSWEGNVRELEQTMERASILAGAAATILPEHLSLASGDHAAREFFAETSRA